MDLVTCVDDMMDKGEDLVHKLSFTSLNLAVEFVLELFYLLNVHIIEAAAEMR